MTSTTTRPPRTAGALVADAVADLTAAVARLAALTGDGALAEIPPATLVELTAALHRSVDQAAAVATVSTGVVHASGVLPLEGFASTKAWLLTACRKSDTEAKALLASSTALRDDFPATAAAWLAGEVPGGAVRELTRGIGLAVRALPAADRPVRAAQAEEVLLALARRAPVADVALTARYLRLVADPDGVRQAQLDAYDDQQLTLTPVGVGYRLSGYLTAETAAAVGGALDAVVDGWYRTGSLTPRDQPGGHPALDAQHRRARRAHLLALALAELATRALDTGALGSRHGVRPHVTLTADLDQLLTGLGGRLHLPGQEQPVLLPDESVRRILCDADLHPVVTTRPGPEAPEGAIDADGTDSDASDPAASDAATGALGPVGDAWRDLLADRLSDRGRRVLYVGRTRRTVSPRLRRALEVRDGHCAFPGCHVDVTRTHAHHVQEWEHAGATDISNTVLLCVTHHHAVHEGRWTVAATAGVDPHTTGCWTFAPPRTRP